MKKKCGIVIKEELREDLQRAQDELVQVLNKKIAQYPSFQFTGFTSGYMGDDFVQNKFSIRLEFVQKDVN